METNHCQNLTSECRHGENTSAGIRGVVKWCSQQHTSAGANPQSVAVGQQRGHTETGCLVLPNYVVAS